MNFILRVAALWRLNIETEWGQPFQKKKMIGAEKSLNVKNNDKWKLCKIKRKVAWDP